MKKAMVRKIRLRISRIFAAVLLVVIVFSSSAWKDTVPVFGAILSFMGILLVGIAAVGRLWCSLYIGGFKTHTLITQGPYSLCRNPLYFFSFIGAVGVGLATETLVFTAVIAIVFVLYYPLVIKAEEQVLREEHGKAFDDYVSVTPKVFPGLSRLNEPDTYTVNPKFYRRNMVQVIWFIWAVGLLQLIAVLRGLDVIPTLFHVY